MSVTVVYGGQEFPTPNAFATKFLADLDGFADRAARRVTQDLYKYLQTVAAAIAHQHGTAWSAGSRGGTTLHVRSGEGLRSIMRSIAAKNGGTFSTVEGSISTGTMGIHETGGIITAKAGGYLTIPLPAALDARGVPLKPEARDWPNTFVQRSKRGNLIIFQSNGKAGITPLYVLKSLARIPPRLGLEQKIMGTIPYFMETLLDSLAKEFEL